jgi:hypothetical protein
MVTSTEEAGAAVRETVKQLGTDMVHLHTGREISVLDEEFKLLGVWK